MRRAYAKGSRRQPGRAFGLRLGYLEVGPSSTRARSSSGLENGAASPTRSREPAVRASEIVHR